MAGFLNLCSIAPLHADVMWPALVLGKPLETFSILTTTPNAVTSSVHDRMPVILNPDSYDLWLDPGMKDVLAVSELLRPFEAWVMRRYPVSNRINHVAQGEEECARLVQLTEGQESLFPREM